MTAGDPWDIIARRKLITKPPGAVVITAPEIPQDVINAHPSGTTYWFDGTFYLPPIVGGGIKPKTGDTLLTNNAILDGQAQYSQGSRYIVGSAPFLTGCDYGIDIKQAGGDAGVASGVTARGFEIRNVTLQGVRCWIGARLQYLFAHDCLQNGIGGGLGNVPWAGGYQVELTDSAVWDCGAVDGLGSGNGGMKFARTGTGTDFRQGSAVVIPSAPDRGIYLQHVYTWRSIGNGYWNDVTSGGDLITDCIAKENTRKGFFLLEVSVGPSTLEDCTADGNATWLYESPRLNSDAGIVVETSLGATIRRCRVTNNGSNKGIRIGEQGNRIAQHGHGTDDITLLNNNLLDGDQLYIDPDASNVTSTNNGNMGAGVFGASYIGDFDPLLLTGEGEPEPPSFVPGTVSLATRIRATMVGV